MRYCMKKLRVFDANVGIYATKESRVLSDSVSIEKGLHIKLTISLDNLYGLTDALELIFVDLYTLD